MIFLNMYVTIDKFPAFYVVFPLRIKTSRAKLFIKQVFCKVANGIFCSGYFIIQWCMIAFKSSLQPSHGRIKQEKNLLYTSIM